MMYPTDEYIEACFKRELKDQVYFTSWCDSLPERANETPYHSGPHSIRQFRSAINLLQCESWDKLHILETGFCLGHSASIFFGLGVGSVTSVDNSDRVQTRDAAAIMKAKYGDGFYFVRGSAAEHTRSLQLLLAQRKYDLMFVDGGHEFKDVDADVKLGLSLGIKNFLLDDFFPHWGPGVQPAIRQNKLIPVAILGTMMLARVADGFVSHE